MDPVLDKICDKIVDLMELDVENTSLLVASHALDKLPVLLDNMKDNKKLQLALLKSVFFHKTK